MAQGRRRRDRHGAARQAGLRRRGLSPPTTPAYRTYTAALIASRKQVPQPAQWDADLYSVADYDSVVIMALAMDAAHSTKPSV